jgi:DNA-binding response OmpR family regulator
MAHPATDPFLSALGPHIEALETARAALATDPAAGLSLLRLAAVLERSGEQHGFSETSVAARAVLEAGPDRLGAAADQLLYTLLGARVNPLAREQTVLVIDDDPALTRLLQAILAKPRRQIRVAGTATEMLEILRARRVDLMVLDLSLPDLDGREILVALRRNPLTAALPILVISAARERRVEAECLALGANRFLPKPFDPIVMGNAVSDLLASPPPAASVESSSPPEPEPAQGPTEVLLAEHDPLTARIIRHRLGREGYVVRHFASGSTAWSAARSLTPGIVVLDALTPGIDGIELVTRLRTLPGYRQTPILVLSDIGSEREVVRALGAGADDCIRKPFSPTELVARIERLLQRR